MIPLRIGLCIPRASVSDFSIISSTASMTVRCSDLGSVLSGEGGAEGLLGPQQGWPGSQERRCLWGLTVLPRVEHRSPGTPMSRAFNIYYFSVSHMESPLTYGIQGPQKVTTSPVCAERIPSFFFSSCLQGQLQNIYTRRGREEGNLRIQPHQTCVTDARAGLQEVK